MDILEEQQDGVVIVAPKGRIDSTTSTPLEQKLLSVLERKPRAIIIDFTAIDYISSAGLRVVLMVAKRLRGSGAALALCQLNGFILEVFKMSGFDKVLTIVATRAEAHARLA